MMVDLDAQCVYGVHFQFKTSTGTYDAYRTLPSEI